MKIANSTPLVIYLFFVSVLIFSQPAEAGKTIIIDKNTEVYPLEGACLEYLEEKDKRLTIDDVTAERYSGNFQINEQKTINLGYTHSAYWIRFTVQNNLPEEKVLFMEIAYALLDYVSFFSPNPEGGYRETSYGQYVLFHKRKIKHRNFVFKHTFPPESGQTFYLRIETQDSLTVPMKLFTQDEFINKERTEQMILGIFYGSLIIIMLYNLFIFFSVREMAYLYLVLFMLSFLVYILSENGLAYAYLWPQFPWWSKRAIPFSVSCAIITSGLFVQSFIQTKQYTKTLDRAISIFRVLGFAGMPVCFIAPYYYSVMYVVLIIVLYSPLLIVAGFFCLLKGSRPAVFFLSAWMFTAVGSVVYGLKAFGILPEVFITKYGVSIGASFQMVLLSLGLADKINTMKNNLRDTNKNFLQTKAALKESGHKFRMIAENVSDIIWIMDLDTYCISYASPSITHIAGYTPEEALVLPMEKILLPDYLEPTKEKLEALLEKDRKGEIESLEARAIELEMYRKDGSKFWAEVKSSFLKDNNGKPFGLLGVTRNIDERKRVEEALKDAKKAAESANIAKSIFLANMSHEIRTPMNAIIGMGDLMMTTGLKDKQKEYLNIIRASSKSLLQLINDILDFSKIEAGKLEFEEIPFSLRDVLEGIAGMLLEKMHAKKIELIMDIDEDLPDHLIGDPLRLRQVLVNLTNNAFKFTEKGKIVISVKHQSSSPDMIELLFCVKDSGIGIPQDQISQNGQMEIFKAFTQADGSTTRKYGGTGLGLAICKKIVELMNGKIWVESDVGKGSAFFFTAMFEPMLTKEVITEAGDPAATKEHKSSEEVKSFDALKGLSILVVEDNLVNQMVASEILMDNGVLVKTADSGLKAIEMIKENKFDAVLMDIQMPEIDGIETTKYIRQNLNMSELPIIAMTAHAMRGDRERCLEVGMNDYIPKPVDRNQMLDIIRKTLS